MLPPYIIEQIRKREHDEAREAPVIQLPLPQPPPPRAPKPAPEETEQRGVFVIDLV